MQACRLSVEKGHGDVCCHDLDRDEYGDGGARTDLECNDPKDAKELVICLTSCGRFAYCSRCHISRCFRDAKYIAVKKCMPVDLPSAREGERGCWA